MGLRQERQKKLYSCFDQGMIYLVTEQNLSQMSTEDIVKLALQGGVRMIQMREKSLSKRQRLELAYKLRDLTNKYDALLFIDDEVDIALMSGADGVHLGQDDLPILYVKQSFPDLLLGSSTHNEAEIKQAILDGADYLNIGPIFPTQTKDWHGEWLGLDNLTKFAKFVNIPFTVMGGIKEENIPDLVKHGARICAMVTQITQAENPQEQSTVLLEKLRSHF